MLFPSDLKLKLKFWTVVLKRYRLSYHKLKKGQNSVRFIRMAFRAGITKLADVVVAWESVFSKSRHTRRLIFNLLRNWKCPKIPECNFIEFLICP